MPDAPAYTIEIIQAPPCIIQPLTIGTAIAGGGVVAGYHAVCTSTKYKAFTYSATGGKFTSLPFVPGFSTMKAWDINDAGHVVGGMETSAGVCRAFLAVDGIPAELATPDGYAGSEALGLNSAGTVIVGASFAPSASEPTVWIDGVPAQLILPLGPNGHARDINDAGQVVGWMGLSTVSSSSAFLPGGTGVASAINQLGEIVGTGVMPDPGGRGFTSRAIRWSNGVMTDLGTLNGYFLGAARDVNNHSEIVGYCWNIPPFGNGQKAFIWRNGVMTALNTLIPPAGPLDITIAHAIDNEGRITGQASDGSGHAVAVRLTPIPSIPGDFNRDGSVNAADLGILLGAWGLPGVADIDRSGAVDGADLAIVLGNWTG